MAFIGLTGIDPEDPIPGKTAEIHFPIPAMATGVEEEDLASTVETLRAKFGITDEAELRSCLANMIVCGKPGAFAMDDSTEKV